MYTVDGSKLRVCHDWNKLIELEVSDAVTSSLWDEYCLTEVCLAWEGRSIPFAQKVIKHGSATVDFSDYYAYTQYPNRNGLRLEIGIAPQTLFIILQQKLRLRQRNFSLLQSKLRLIADIL
jgi:hypothetical protein